MPESDSEQSTSISTSPLVAEEAPTPVTLGSGPLSLADMTEIASGANTRLDPSVLPRIDAARELANSIARIHPVYGRTTGVGANRSTVVDVQDDEHGLRLLRSHATDIGDEVPRNTVRLMLAIRVNQLSTACSGISPDVVEALHRLIEVDAIPVTRSLGSIGTADLAALAGLGLAMVGERPTVHEFDPLPGFDRASALPFMSSSALTVARASLALHDIKRLDEASRIITALSATAVKANPQAFSSDAARATAVPAANLVAHDLRRLVGDSVTPGRIQDPFGIRAYVPSQATVVDSGNALESHLKQLTYTAQENPLFNPESHQVIHHGGFHQAALGLKVDAVNLAVAQSTPLILSRITMLHEPKYTGLTPFLASGPAGSSGHMMTEYVAASAMAEIRHAAQPASLMTSVLSRGAEEDASFAPQAVTQMERVVEHYRVMLGVELLSAHRAIWLAGVEPSDPLEEALGDIDTHLPLRPEDHDLRPYLDSAIGLLDDLRLSPSNPSEMDPATGM